MKFRFDVHISEQDYIDLNKFMMFRSPYGKKTFKQYRILLAVVFALCILISLFGGNFTLETVLGAVPLIIIAVLCQVFLKSFFSFVLKANIKAIKKSGKKAYSPDSVMEFYKDCLVEKTSDYKVEHKYSAFEHISIVDNKMIYFHINNIISYTMPLSVFESKEQYDGFMELINSKCSNIEVYY